MKKIIFVMMLLVGALSFAGQAGLEEYRYSQGNSSFVGIENSKSELALTNGQAGIKEYNYTKNSTTLIGTNDLSDKMARSSNVFDKRYVNGQSGYAEYKYIQGGSSVKVSKF